MSLKKDILWRVGLVYIMVLMIGILIIGKILYLQLAEKEKWINKAEELTVRNIEIPPNRGDIYSHDERLLASSVPYYEIRIDMKSKALTDKLFNKHLDSLSLCLASLFNDRPASLYKKQLMDARRNGKRYFLVKNRVTYNELREIKKFPLFRLGRYNSGVLFVQKSKRFQPHGNLASRTIGYTSKADSGNIVGIEGAYDHYLRGEKGMGLMQKISGGGWIPVQNSNFVNPKDGNDVITTLDINLQDVAESALRKQLQLNEANYGTAILMEVKTGEIKAMVNLKKDINGRYRELYNYAIGESTEPGSTFKLASLMVALEDGVIDLDDVVNTGNGVAYYYDMRLEDDKSYGTITVQKAFEVSSNVGISKIIADHYKGKEDKFINRLYSMNLNEALGVEIKGEGKPEIKYPGDKLWHGASLPMISIGYEVKLTPLQILAFYNAIANDGEMIKPKFVREIRYHGKHQKTFHTEVINSSISSASTIKKAKKLLEGVVENGTANNLKNPNYKIAGKTGTAKISESSEGYKNEYRASFVGYFPADNPLYSCIIVISSPSRNLYYGRDVAGPVFKEISDQVYATSFALHEALPRKTQIIADIPYSKIGYRPDLDYVLDYLDMKGKYAEKGMAVSDWVVTIKRDNYVEYKNYTTIKNLVPNVKEMGAKDAVYLLENAGFEVIVKGRGKVVSQSIPPGVRIEPGRRIILEMSFM